MLKLLELTIAGVAQGIEHGPANQRVASLIPSRDTCLGCGPGPQQGACQRQPYIDVSLPLFLLPLSLKIKKIFKKKTQKTTRAQLEIFLVLPYLQIALVERIQKYLLNYQLNISNLRVAEFLLQLHTASVSIMSFGLLKHLGLQRS